MVVAGRFSGGCWALLCGALVTSTVADAAEPAADGASLYRKNCVACHGTAADGRGPAAAALRPRPTDFTDAGWWGDRTDAQVIASVRTGRPGTAMMAYGSLSDAELAALVEWLRTQASP